ncbi:MAG: hypothetical protein IMZ62_10475 [Chloroflexi bacterium]|nr:hypothetical protein [Chloroflexota bacterium]MBE3117894.1 hypothetical protein [Candidatus Atribacteria bacterium]
MPYTGDQLYGKEFEPLIELLAQQKTSLLRGRVAFKRVINAEEAYFHQIQPLDAPTANTERHGDTPSREAVLLRRQVVPLPFEDGYLIDKPDVARMVVSPENVIVQSLGSSFGRWVDDLIIASVIADVKIGKAGGTSVTFAAESVGVNAVTGGTISTLGTAVDMTTTPVTMELAKILAMAQIFDNANVPETDRKYWAISPKDKRAMLDIEEITSSDFSTKRLETGVIGNFAGFDFIVTTRLLKDSTSVSNRTFAWSEGGLGFASIGDLSVSVDRRPDKKNSTGIYATIDAGAVRVEGAKVHECGTAV